MPFNLTTMISCESTSYQPIRVELSCRASVPKLNKQSNRKSERGAEGGEVDVSRDLELSSEQEDIVEKKSYLTSVVWRYSGNLRSDVERGR